MRRRPPHLLHLSPGEVAYLKTLVEDGRTEQRIARRARVLLAMTDPDTVVSELADRLELERTTIWNLCRRYQAKGVDVVLEAPRSGRPRELSPPCNEWRWSSWHVVSRRAWAWVARQRGIAPTISHSTVALLLHDADLQPHRTRYWKTPTLDDTFRHKAAQVLGCYEQAQQLAQREEVVLCVDDKPNIQVLHGKQPLRPIRSGLIEHREFEYVRRGTVNLLVKLVVHSGLMRSWDLERNDGVCLRAVLPQLLWDHRDARRIHLLWDNAPSHTARQTHDFLRTHYPHVRVLFTPAHASWLNQAELLLRAFTERYLQRGDWAAVTSSSPTSTPAGPSTTASTPTPSPGPGLAPRCTSGWTGTCPDYVEKLVGHSTRLSSTPRTLRWPLRRARFARRVGSPWCSTMARTPPGAVTYANTLKPASTPGTGQDVQSFPSGAAARPK
jgi:transposase